MDTIAPSRPSPVPCYGSAAQLATYSGLSPRTIRRLVKAGELRGFKVGRRLVVPYSELDRFILKCALTRAAVLPTPGLEGEVEGPDPVEAPADETPAAEPSRPLQVAPDHSGPSGAVEVFDPFGNERW
jgi:excisionase family DNA binding protein